MDRVEAIKMVLLAIWEPEFELINRSFGFRPNKSCGDAIAALTSTKSQGLFAAIEGDIQEAYDKVPKDKLLDQLAEKIDDNNFVKFMKKRLNYDYVDDSGRHRPKTGRGRPQGGIDSPYLFNIHLLALDRFIHDPENGLQAEVNRLNSRITTVHGGSRYKPGTRLNGLRSRYKRELTQIRDTLKSGAIHNIDEIYELRKKRYDLMSKVRRINVQFLDIPYYDPASRRIRVFYVRYADD
ncbi:MAG: reverse transcriptase/maturase family protein, partial [Candidatus Paceibacteria bacterium]